MHHSRRRRGWCADDALGLVYYNYRHLEPVTGRWLRRDPLLECSFILYKVSKRFNVEYLYGFNSGALVFDWVGLDNPGCDIPSNLIKGSNVDCFRRCCANHDKCYYSRNGTYADGRCRCTAGSWSMNVADYFAQMDGGLAIFDGDPCKKCNSDAVSCFMRCIGGKDSGGDRWFCPNGEHAGKTYNSWSEIPSSCFESGVKPPWPPDEDPPPIQIPPYYRPTYAELLVALNGVYF